MGKLEDQVQIMLGNRRIEGLTPSSHRLGSPRVNTDANGAVTARHDYYPFGEEITTSQRVVGLGYTSDTVRKQFTGYERDDETGLDFAQARFYSKNLGRFNSADPLYIELRRLNDPQQLNLYGYTRNNPMRFTDPLGLDIEVIGETQDDYLRRLEQNLSFKVNQNKGTGKVQIVDANGNVLDKKALKQLEKSLEKKGEKGKAELGLFKAITDTKNHVVIDTVAQSADVDGGKFNGNGYNTIDSSDLSILDNSSDTGGFTAAQLVGHETMEAYYSAVNKSADVRASHAYANKFFPGLTDAISPNARGTENAGYWTHERRDWSVQDKNSARTNVTLRIEKQFVTPIPSNAYSPGAPGHIVDIRRVP